MDLKIYSHDEGVNTSSTEDGAYFYRPEKEIACVFVVGAMQQPKNYREAVEKLRGGKWQILFLRPMEGGEGADHDNLVLERGFVQIFMERVS